MPCFCKIPPQAMDIIQTLFYTLSLTGRICLCQSQSWSSPFQGISSKFYSISVKTHYKSPIVMKTNSYDTSDFKHIKY